MAKKTKEPVDIKKLVYEYPTKHKFGFMPDELKDIVSKFPKINMDKYNDAMMGNTCAMVDEKLVIYHCDVLKALICGIENRDLRIDEWD